MVPVEQAGLLITERVESVAILMITPQTARRHFDPLALAESLAASLRDDRPGKDMFDLARDTTVALALLGRCIAGLAEAINVRIVNEAPRPRSPTSATWPGPCPPLISSPQVPTTPTGTRLTSGCNEPSSCA